MWRNTLVTSGNRFHASHFWKRGITIRKQIMPWICYFPERIIIALMSIFLNHALSGSEYHTSAEGCGSSNNGICLYTKIATTYEIIKNNILEVN